MARKSRMSRRLHGLTLRGLAMAAVGEAVLIVLVMGQPAFEQVMISVAVTVAIAVGGFGIYLAPGLLKPGPAPRSTAPRKPKPSAPRAPVAPILRVIPQPARAAAAPWHKEAPQWTNTQKAASPFSPAQSARTTRTEPTTSATGGLTNNGMPGGRTNGPTPNPHIADAISALANLGYKADLAKRLVMAAAAAAPADADVSTLVKLALKR